MRNIFIKGAMAIAGAILFLSSYTANAQTTSWPYAYPDFVEGAVYMAGGQKLIEKLNVHLSHSQVHYVDNGVVKELELGDVVAIELGSDKYVPYGSSVYKVICSKGESLLLSQSLGDFAALAETGGAYGTSSASSATRKLSSLDAASTIGCNHIFLLQSKSDGQVLPLVTKFYIYTPELFCRAGRRDLDAAFDSRIGEWKSWLKENRIKWNNPESLAKILDFMR